MLDFSDMQPLAAGRHRLIYRHPQDDDLLVKVLRPELEASGIRRLSRAGKYTGFVRELKEYLVLRARTDARDLPIARVAGLVETTLGAGLCVEKIRGADGRLAPTLERLATQHGFSTDLVTAVAVLVQRLIKRNIVLGDLHAGNMVLRDDANGEPRFVLIDGFGEKNIIPLRSMSHTLNRHNTLRLHRKLLREMHRDYAITS